MTGPTTMALGALFMWFAVGTIGVAAEAAEEEVKMVFRVDGMR